MVSEERIWKKLEKVHDPEFGKPVTEMNLIDVVKVDNGTVSIVYHLTAPMCPPPFALSIGKQIRKQLLEIDEINNVKIRVQKHMQAEMLNKRLRDEE